MLIFIEQNIATEIDPEQVIEEFKVLILGKKRLELYNCKRNTSSISNICNKYK